MKYYYVANNEMHGPFSLEEMVNHNITLETLVWHQGLADWTPANQVTEVYEALQRSSMPPPINPVINDPTASDSHQFTPMPDDERTVMTPIGKIGHGIDSTNNGKGPIGNTSQTSVWKRYKGLFITFGAVIVLMVLLAATCPDKNAHRSKVSNVATEVVGDMVSQGIGSNVAGFGVSLLASGLADKLFDRFFKFHSYGFFSTCEYDFANHQKTVSFGILGHVFTFNSEQVEEWIAEETGYGKNLKDMRSGGEDIEDPKSKK